MEQAAVLAETGSGVRQQGGARLRAPTILALLLLVHAGWFVWESITSTTTIDFFMQWSVPHALARKPITNFYSEAGQRDIASVAMLEAASPGASRAQQQATEDVIRLNDGRIDAIGTPFLYTVFGSLSSGDFRTDQKRYMVACVLCLSLAILVLGNLLRFPLIATSLLILFAVTDYAPVLSDIRMGNVNDIQLLAVVLFILLTARARPLLAGLVIGAVTMFKPTTAIVLVLSVVVGFADRDFRHLLRMLAGALIAAAGAFAASVAFFRGPTVWVNFLNSLHGTLGGVSYPLQHGNFSLPVLLFGATSGRSAVIPLAFVAAFSWLLFATRRSADTELPATQTSETEEERRMHTAFAVGGGGCAIMLLSSPLVWVHYYILLLPLSLYVMRPVFDVPLLNAKDVASSAGSLIPRRIAFALPFVLLSMFSFLIELIVVNDLHSLKLWCVLIILATASTLALASYYIWQERKAFA